MVFRGLKTCGFPLFCCTITKDEHDHDLPAFHCTNQYACAPTQTLLFREEDVDLS
jgi:hypothetical protein